MTNDIIRGRAWKLGDNVDTDAIIPARYLNLATEEELRRHCLENLIPDFSSNVNRGDVIVAGRNFGCGSSREHAAIVIKGSGISCIIAVSFARIFYRNAFNLGLPILECEDAYPSIREGDELEIRLNAGRIIDITRGSSFKANGIPPFMLEILNSGGLMNMIKEKHL